MAILPRAAAVRHAGGGVCPPPRPAQHLLVRPVPAPLAARIRLHRPTYDPPASHLPPLSGAGRLGRRAPASAPRPPARRIRLRRPTYDPPASHLPLLSGGVQLGSRSPAWTDRGATVETSSAAGASDAPGRTCHLRLGHLDDVVQELGL